MITPELKYAYIVKKSSAFICLLSELHMNIHQQTKKKKKKSQGIYLYIPNWPKPELSQL